jgi:hypothetical protein
LAQRQHTEVKNKKNTKRRYQSLIKVKQENRNREGGKRREGRKKEERKERNFGKGRN